ncbi:hypothetical protein PCH70_38890 [Pseudomonas cichorii JBC1]|nr:hypothetical protein PCH70_38890 [Pseudomonas cichorii JBC1]
MGRDGCRKFLLTMATDERGPAMQRMPCAARMQTQSRVECRPRNEGICKWL